MAAESAAQANPMIEVVNRFAKHLAALSVAICAIVLAQIDWQAIAPQPDTSTADQSRALLAQVTSRGETRAGQAQIEPEAPIQLAMLRTEIGHRPTSTPVKPSPSPAPTGVGGLAYEIVDTPTPDTLETITRTEVITYEVQPGDYVGAIAAKFGISDDTLCWANGKLADNPDYLRVGQHLYILPTDGVLHIVEKGDTLSEIAQTYKAEVQAIIDYAPNGLQESPVLVEEQPLIIPNGTKPYVPRTVSAWSGPIVSKANRGTGTFVWPTSGVITTKFWSKHQAVDIAWTEGTPIIAADSGVVVLTAYSPAGYGRYVIIDHGNGFRTLYAHFSMFFVKEGQAVAKGQQIGLMGNTGRSTGPHLHFEIRKGVTKVNPLTYLP